MEINKLTAVGVANHKKKGRYADGNGLYLNIQADGNKNWLYRYQLRGKRHWMGLGGYDKKINSLATAREKALKAKALVGRGIDPISHREDEIRNNAEKVLISAQNKEMEDKLNSMTFKVCATDYINKMKGEWTNEKHTQQWRNTLAKYAYPFIGEMPVKDIQIEDVKRCLDPIWSTKTETASRVRQRIGSILSFSIAHKYRQHSNPAIWKGLMDQFYPRPDKVKQKRRELEGTSEHHEALPYQNMPSFIVELRKLGGTAPIALYFTILTACRTSEVRFATWDEFDLAKKEWNIPKERMKARKMHRVALSNAAVELLNSMPRVNNFVFSGWKYDTCLSDGAMLDVLKDRMDMNVTVHGMRSTFRDYIGEETGFPHRLAEFALAHQLKDGAERAYARGDLLKKRFRMMNAWADYIGSRLAQENVIHIHNKINAKSQG